jgi:two-component system cell cycle sensor histidine kinase/response regulator CckA
MTISAAERLGSLRRPLDAGRDAAAVVDDRDRVVGVERGDDDVVAVAGQRLVDGVVDDLEHHVVQAGAVVGVADVHAGPLAHRLQALEDLDTQAEACAELVKQIMFSSSKSLLNLRKVNLSTLLSNLVIDAVHVLKIDTGAIDIRQHISPDMPAIWIDHEMFRQAIRHLIHNAVLAMPRGGVLTVSAQGAKPGKPGDTDFVLIEITDTGEGIRTEHMGKIFDPFFTTRNRAEARGMGLPMVQGMVTQMGGWIEIQSAPGKGTRVALHLPTQAPGQKSTPPGGLRDEDGTRAVAVIPTGRMLIADDEDYVLKLISRVFSKEGWDITEATSFYEVLNSLETRKEHYDVLILDVSMPGPSAEETLQRILDAGCKAHILLVSGLPGSERMDHLIKLSNGIFISKPFSLGNLVDRVEKLMASG